ncbi:hypothetical protein DMB42_25300 [Nonomuraea sp. WAC 01424]|uniref:phosphoribosyltransferase n=1 Tax=Nonomuraea sp. WAC 01424 TaxID=2203200 RepID=UPI000F7B5C1E|nr:phosphoribosyltransferase [Nonomuraea sp. WAC 01424]RSN06599.1 hypothetical protein DMB42_25300 [Nonomuraea sp. WAC 01424]
MGDARAVTEPYLQILREVPPAGPGVCRICHTGTDGPFELCATCRITTQGLHRHTEHVVPVSLCVRDGDGAQLHAIVTRRRDPPGSLRRVPFLAATLARFHQAHAACLTRLAGGPFTMVTTLPGTSLDRPVEVFAPMPRVVDLVGDLRRLHRPVLLPGSAAAAENLARRRPDERAFQVMGRVDGARVLLVDDLFVSGAHVQSAASALHLAGARSVVALVIARLVFPRANGNTARIWGRASAERFSFDRCCCSGAPTVDRATDFG